MSFRYLLIITIFFAVAGCGKGTDHGVLNIPTLPSNPRTGETVPSHHLVGTWDVTIPADRSSAEIIPLRSATMHINTVKLLETPSWSTNLRISNIHVVEPNVLEADVTLTHPYPGYPAFTGFDVRGMLIAQADSTFPISDRMAGLGDSVPHMLNPDGFTSLFNPTEYPESGPALPIFKYYAGKYATGGDLNATLFPFLAFKEDTERRMFEAGGSETRTYRIYAPPGPIHFGYAVDACWEHVDNVTNPLVDFPPEANCLEAYKVDVTMEDSNSNMGSSVPVSIEVFDHQGLESISAVMLEAPDLFSGESNLVFSDQTGDESFLFTGSITNENGAIWGDYPMLVRVIDAALDPNLGPIDAFQIAGIHVKEGWARSWGGLIWNRAEGVAVDASGDILVAGTFDGDTDLDPGPGVDIHHCNGSYDSTLCKFDSNGVYIWGKNWGGAGCCESYGMAIDNSGNSYVLGYFTQTVDFDPGAGVENRTSDSDWNQFIVKLNPDGNFVWVRTWPTDGNLYSTSVSASAYGDIYIAGEYRGTVDFDPGSGEDIHESSLGGDAMLIKLGADGNYHWAKSWGPRSAAISAAPDSHGNIYVTGYFQRTVDFDPGSSVDSRTPQGSSDAFLTCFNPDGDYLGVKTWGGTDGNAQGTAISFYGSDMYIAGSFSGTVDLDPGPGEDNHVSTNTSFHDAYLSKLDTVGNYEWGLSWGGIGMDIVQAVSAGPMGIYVTGGFSDTVDFDPGPGVDEHTAETARHMYLSFFGASGNFQWANTWNSGSGAINDGSRAVCSDAEGNAYLAGCFRETVDFDPTSGVDNHTPDSSLGAFLSKNLPDGTW